MTYEGETAEGVRVRLHIDNLDAEFAYVLTCGPSDHDRWSRPLELRQVRD